MEWVAANTDDIIIEARGRPKAVLISYGQYEDVLRLRDEATRQETSRLVARIFGGSIPAVANSLMSLDDVGLDDLAEIKRLIQEREDELKRGKS